MAIEKKTRIQELISQTAAELSDASHRRWSADTLTAYVNEALRRMAEEGVFRRTDLHSAQAGVGLLPTLAEPVRLEQVYFEGRELAAATEAELLHLGGPAWRSRRGRPARYVPLADGVRLYPAPELDGPELLLPADPVLDEKDGAKIDGDGWVAASDGASTVHFRESDPGAPDLSVPGSVRIDYFYYPRPSEAADSVPTRFAEAIRRYLLYRCLATGEAPEEARSAEVCHALWLEALTRVTTHAVCAARAEALWFAPVKAL